MNALGHNVTDDTFVSAPHSSFFRNISRILGSTDKRTVINYLVMKKLVDFAGATTSTMRRINLAYQSAKTGIDVPAPRSVNSFVISLTCENHSLKGGSIVSAFLHSILAQNCRS